MAENYVECHKLKCIHCHQVFFTNQTISRIHFGRVKCPSCGGLAHDILDNSIPDFLAKNMNIPVYADNQRYLDLIIPRSRIPPTSDMYDSFLYSLQERYKNKIETYFFNTEENNMKRTTNNNEETRNFEIVRKYSTDRGIFTVGKLEPTDMFVLIDDEDQTVYMAVYEEEPKYKTKKAVVDMHSGNLLYFDLETKIYVYRPGSSELRVGEFMYSSKDYK